MRLHRFLWGAVLLGVMVGITYSQTPSWSLMTAGTGTLYGAAWSPERAEYIVVGATGQAYTSPDAVIWTSRPTGSSATLYDVAWGSGLYVAVGSSGQLRTSPDGLTWTSRNSKVSTDLMSVAWIAPSSTASGQWMAVGMGGAITTSPNGVDWTKQTSGLETAGTFLLGIAWANPQSTSTGMAIAVGEAGTILTSTNGSTWTQRTSGSSASLDAVVWTGTYAMAVGHGGVLISGNATSWLSRSGFPVSGLTGIAWAPGAGAGSFVISGSGQSTNLRTSTDTGRTWTTAGVTGDYYSVKWGGGHFIAVGSNGRVQVSHDGVLPGTPVPKTPADSSTGIPLTPTLGWAPVAGVKTYHVQLSSNPLFNTAIPFNDTAVVDTTRVSTALTETTDYFWRVRARNVAGYGAWSATRKFKTLQLPPAAVSLSLPTNKSTGLGPFVELSWNSVNSASGYAIQVALDSGFSAPLQNDSIPASAARTITYGPLAYNTTYYWRVRGYNTENGPWTMRSFTTEPAPSGAPAAPVLTTPTIFATDVSLSPTFAWNRPAGAVYYQIQIAARTDFATRVSEDSSLTKPAFSPSASLSGNTEHYWRVRARNSFGSSPWSDVGVFTTVITKPNAPELGSPAAFVIDLPIPATLTWSSALGATSYHVQLALSADFPNYVMRDSTLTTLSKSTGTLSGNTPYFWRVRAKNSAGVSDWSSIRRFTTGEVVALAAGQGPHGLGLRAAGAQRFLRFALPRRERVVIRTFDLRGGNQADVADLILDAGPHQVRIPEKTPGDLRILVFRTETSRETLLLGP